MRPCVRRFFMIILLQAALHVAFGQEFRNNYKEWSFPPRGPAKVDSAIPAGAYNVGSGQYFPTLDSALSRLSRGGILGPVTLLLTDTLYVPLPAGNGAFVLIGPVTGAGPASRITVRPAENVAVTIRGWGEAVLLLDNVSFLTLDGVSLEGNTRLTFHAEYNTAGTQWNDVIDLIGNGDFNAIQNLTAWTDDTERVSAAIFLGASGFGGPDSCLIAGVAVRSARLGIYIAGFSSPWPYRPHGNIIRNNHVGSPTDSLVSRGIQTEGADGTLIEGNHVENLRLTLPDGGGTMRVHGIMVYAAGNAIVRNNIVHGIYGTRPQSTVNGILATGGVVDRGQNVWLYNNMVYDIRNQASSDGHLAGIHAWYQDALRVYDNSVDLEESGDSAPGAGSAAGWFESSNVLPSLLNNVFVNGRDDAPARSCAMRLDPAPGISDHNNLYVPVSPSAFVATRFNLGYGRLADWQTTGNDHHTVSVMPVFRAPHLHIDSTHVTPDSLDGRGIPVAGILYDIDGQVRHPAAPDIGADEFDLLVSVGEGGPASPRAFSLQQNYPNPFNPTTEIGFQITDSRWVALKVYDVLGNEVATLVNEIKEPGTYTVQWDASGVASGMYMCRLQAGAFVAVRKLIVLR